MPDGLARASISDDDNLKARRIEILILERPQTLLQVVGCADRGNDYRIADFVLRFHISRLTPVKPAAWFGS